MKNKRHPSDAAWITPVIVTKAMRVIKRAEDAGITGSMTDLLLDNMSELHGVPDAHALLSHLRYSAPFRLTRMNPTRKRRVKVEAGYFPALKTKRNPARKKRHGAHRAKAIPLTSPLYGDYAATVEQSSNGTHYFAIVRFIGKTQADATHRAREYAKAKYRQNPHLWFRVK